MSLREELQSKRWPLSSRNWHLIYKCLTTVGKGRLGINEQVDLPAQKASWDWCVCIEQHNVTPLIQISYQAGGNSAEEDNYTTTYWPGEVNRGDCSMHGDHTTGNIGPIVWPDPRDTKVLRGIFALTSIGWAGHFVFDMRWLLIYRCAVRPLNHLLVECQYSGNWCILCWRFEGVVLTFWVVYSLLIW